MPTLKNDSTKLVGGKQIKQDVSGWGSFEIIECKISNIRKQKKFLLNQNILRKCSIKNDMVDIAIYYRKHWELNSQSNWY